MVKMMKDEVITQLVSLTSKSNMLGTFPSLALVALGPVESLPTTAQMGYEEHILQNWERRSGRL
jgi:hypothetical protein